MSQDLKGVNLLLAIQDHAIPEAEELETEAADLRARAHAMEGRAAVLRKIHAAAAPHFPTNTPRLLRESA